MIDLDSHIAVIRNAETVEDANAALEHLQRLAARREATVAEYMRAWEAWREVWADAERERMAKLPDMRYGPRCGGNWTGD